MTEPIINVTTTDKSLWTPSEDNTWTVVTTYNGHGNIKHPRGTVTVQMRQVGQGSSGGYILLDGAIAGNKVNSSIEVISGYPYEFVAVRTFEIEGWRIDPDAPYTILTYDMMHPFPTGGSYKYTYNHREANVYIYWDDSDRPAAPTCQFVYDADSGKMVLSGADSSMEYRLKSQTPNDWVPFTDEPVYFDSPNYGAGTVYYVRYAAKDGEKASQTQEIVLPAKQSAPSVKYSTSEETVSGLNSRMEMQIQDNPYEQVTESTRNLSSLIDGIEPGGSVKVRVRYCATETAQPGRDTVFTLYARGETPSTVTFDPIRLELSGCSSALEYRGDTDSAWKAISGSTLALTTYASGERDVEVLVRTKSTSSASASHSVKITIPRLRSGPVGNIDYTNEVISNLANGNYQYSTSGTSWTSVTVADGQWDISKLIASTTKTVYLRTAVTETAPISASTIFELPARLAKPTTPGFVYDDEQYPGKAVLTGLTPDMQYKMSTDAEWTNVYNTEGVVFDIPSASTTYYVRNKATDQAFASLNQSLTLSKPGSTPGCSYNSTTEMITSLTNKMEMKIGNGAYEPVTETSFSTTELIDRISTGGSAEIRVRTQATATAPASADKVFTLYARAAKPTTLTYNTAANSVSGCSSSMQYRLDSATTWTAISGTTLNLQSSAQADRDVKVYIRMKPTTTAAASYPVEFTIPQMLNGPSGTVDYLNESITGLSNGNYQYSTNKSSWTNLTISNGSWDISSLITTSAKNLYLRKAATDTAPITDYTTFSIAARPGAPTSPAFVYNDTRYPGKAVLSGITVDMQYRVSTSSEWANVPNENDVVFEVPAASATYYVRNKPTNDAFASANKSLTLSKPGSAPGCSYNTTTELITSLSTKMEMQIGSGDYETVSETSFSTTELINQIPSGGNTVIHVRTQATATAPASADKVFTLYARAAKPTTLTYNTAANSVSGCSSSMQYRLDSATTWTAISGTTLNLQSSAQADRDVKVYIRMKPTTTAAASYPVEFTIPQMLNGPSGTVDYLNESITGLSNGNYQYSTNKSSWTNLTISNGSWDISSLITTSAKNLYLRKAATDTAPITDYTTFSIAARPGAPTSPAFVYNDTRYPGKAVLSGITVDMQYRVSTSSEWTNVPNENDVVFEVPAASATYYVRNKSTNDAFASANKSLTLSKPGSAPSCSYNTTTELITSLSTKMEMQIGSGDYEAVSETSYSMTELINQIPSGGNTVIRVRTQATATAPASADKVFTLYARAAKPTTLIFDAATNSVSGCSSSMQYRLDSATTWKAISGSTLNLQSSAQTDRDVIVYIRMKPTTTASASLAVELTIPQLTSNQMMDEVLDEDGITEEVESGEIPDFEETTEDLMSSEASGSAEITGDEVNSEITDFEESTEDTVSSEVSEEDAQVKDPVISVEPSENESDVAEIPAIESSPIAASDEKEDISQDSGCLDEILNDKGTIIDVINKQI